MDKRRDAEDAAGATGEEDAEEPFRFGDILDIITLKGFWYMALLCVLFYSAVFPFLKYAPNLMINKFGIDPEWSGVIPALLPFGNILLTPFFGNLYDRKGKGATIMIIGSIMLIIIHFTFAGPFRHVAFRSENHPGKQIGDSLCTDILGTELGTDGSSVYDRYRTGSILHFRRDQR